MDKASYRRHVDLVGIMYILEVDLVGMYMYILEVDLVGTSWRLI